MVPRWSEALRRSSDGDAEAEARAKHRAVCWHVDVRGPCRLAPIAHADREEESCMCGHRELRG